MWRVRRANKAVKQRQGKPNSSRLCASVDVRQGDAGASKAAEYGAEQFVAPADEHLCFCYALQLVWQRDRKRGHREM